MSEVHIAIFPSAAHGDMMIEWDASNHEAIVEHFQRLMDRGVVFYRISDQGRLRKKPVAVPVLTVGEIAERKVLIKDKDIAHLIESGLAQIAQFGGCNEIKTTGAVKTAAEAASTDTVATKPAVGG